MKKLIFLFLVVFLVSCGTPESPVIIVPEEPVIDDIIIDGPVIDDEVVISDFSGGVFKGPFLVGSTVTLYPLDENLNQKGMSYSGDIVSNDGTYNISGIEVSGPVELVATGYYFDEIVGRVTSNQMTMRAITEDTGIVNINLFTALEYDRVKALYNSGLTISKAKEQAIAEIFTAFGLADCQVDSGKIGVTTANGAELLVVSSLFAYNRGAAEVQSLITELRVDMVDGEIDVSDIVAEAKNINADEVKTNLETYYAEKDLIVTVPDFNNVLYELYGSDTLIPNDYNILKLSSEETILWQAGMGQYCGFIIPDGMTLSFRVAELADWVRMYSGYGFTVTGKEATATGPGYCKLDITVLHGPSGYPFSITAIIDGKETIVNYQIE